MSGTGHHYCGDLKWKENGIIAIELFYIVQFTEFCCSRACYGLSNVVCDFAVVR